MTTYRMILISADFPHISLSNGENRTSLAIIVLEIFKKHRCPLYFGVDNSLNLNISGEFIHENLSIVPFRRVVTIYFEVSVPKQTLKTIKFEKRFYFVLVHQIRCNATKNIFQYGQIFIDFSTFIMSFSHKLMHCFVACEILYRSVYRTEI